MVIQLGPVYIRTPTQISQNFTSTALSTLFLGRERVKNDHWNIVMTTKNLFLPIELIGLILLRLPVRYVIRFKCVCKSWLSLISDSKFCISHFDLAAASPPFPRLLLKSSEFSVHSVDTDLDTVRLSLPSITLTTSRLRIYRLLCIQRVYYHPQCHWWWEMTKKNQSMH